MLNYVGNSNYPDFKVSIAISYIFSALAIFRICRKVEMMENTIVIFGSLLLMIEWCYSMMPSISGMFGFQIHPLSTIFHFLGLAKSKVNSKLQESKLLTSSMSNFNDTLKTMSILGNPWNNEGFLLYVIFFGHSRVHQVNWMVLKNYWTNTMF